MLVDLLDLLLLEELPVDLLGDLRGNLRVLGDVLGDLRVLDLAAKTLPLLALLFCRACRMALSPSSQMNCWWTCVTHVRAYGCEPRRAGAWWDC